MSIVSQAVVRLTKAGVVRGIKKMSPIALFVIPFGMAFGVAAIEKGMSFDQSVLMSLLVFSGAAQFAALEFWPEPIPSISLLLSVTVVSLRHVLLGAAMSPWLNQLSRPWRLSALSLLSDANFADSYGAFQRNERDVGRLVGGGLILWAAWVLGTAIGALAGENIGDLERFGIDAVMAAFFTSMIVGQWEGKHTWLPGFFAAVVTVVGIHVLPAGWNIVAAALAGGAIGGLLHGR